MEVSHLIKRNGSVSCNQQSDTCTDQNFGIQGYNYNGKTTKSLCVWAWGAEVYCALWEGVGLHVSLLSSAILFLQDRIFGESRGYWFRVLSICKRQYIVLILLLIPLRPNGKLAAGWLDGTIQTNYDCTELIALVISAPLQCLPPVPPHFQFSPSKMNQHRKKLPPG